MRPLVLTGTVIQGTRSPRALVIDLVPSDDVPNLSVVTAASLQVHRRDGTVESWTCEMSNKTATTLKLTHPWVEGDDDNAGEKLRVYPQLTISGLVIEAVPVVIEVVAR